MTNFSFKNVFECRLPYKQYFGGVSAMSKEQFQKINGFPNNYWGWGGEDDDIYNRWGKYIIFVLLITNSLW